MKIFMLIIELLSSLTIKSAQAVSLHELMTDDGNVFAVYDDLDIGKEYNIIFDTLNTDTVEDDIILQIN